MPTRGRLHTNTRIFTRACWTLIDSLPILNDAVVRGGGASFAWVRERERHLDAIIRFVDPVDLGSFRNVHHQFSVRKNLDRYLRRASCQRAKKSEHYQLHQTPHTLSSSSLLHPGFAVFLSFATCSRYLGSERNCFKSSANSTSTVESPRSRQDSTKRNASSLRPNNSSACALTNCDSTSIVFRSPALRNDSSAALLR